MCVWSCADYACTYKHAWGYIYISPNFLCFEATFSSTKLVLALIEIKALHKVRINEAHPLPFAILNPGLSVVCVCVSCRVVKIKKGFIPGTGTVAEIVTRDGKVRGVRARGAFSFTRAARKLEI